MKLTSYNYIANMFKNKLNDKVTLSLHPPGEYISD